jgi:hypothetical protein
MTVTFIDSDNDNEVLCTYKDLSYIPKEEERVRFVGNLSTYFVCSFIHVYDKKGNHSIEIYVDNP